MANKVYTTMSEESIRYLCGLINKIVSLPTDVISNINLADNLTFSNIHIKDLIDKCLQDANAEAQKLVGALTHLTCEETTVQPTLDNSEINVIYLYSADGNAPYQQYLKISDTKLVDLGSTSISLTNYLTSTEIARDYVTKLNFDALKTKVDKKVDKTDIVDNLTSTDTDKPLSANQGKILNDKKLDKADVGKITALNANGVDIKDFILENCTEKFKEYHIISTPTCTDIPANNYFYMIVRRTGNNTFKVTAKEANCTNEYVRNYRSDTAVWTKWAKVCTTTVEDIPKTNIAPADTTKFVGFKGNSMCNYCVQNGICYVSLWGVQVTVTGRVNTGVILPMPKSGFFGGGYLTGGGDAITHAYAHTIPETGELKFNVKDANTALYGMFSYPVAES